MSDSRPPGAFVHGLEGSVFIGDGELADWLFAFADLEQLRRQHMGENPSIDAKLIAVRHVMWEFRASPAGRTSAPPTACGSAVDLAAEVPAVSEAMSTGQTAKALGITSRAVRLAITEGRLTATQHDGRWLVTPDALERFRARRAA